MPFVLGPNTPGALVAVLWSCFLRFFRLEVGDLSAQQYRLLLQPGVRIEIVSAANHFLYRPAYHHRAVSPHQRCRMIAQQFRQGLSALWIGYQHVGHAVHVADLEHRNACADEGCHMRDRSQRHRTDYAERDHGWRMIVNDGHHVGAGFL